MSTTMMQSLKGCCRLLLKLQWRSQAFGSWENTFGGGSREGSEGRSPPPRAGEFSKICKNLLRKLLKMHYFSIFFEEINKTCVNISCVWTKNTNRQEFFEKMLKIYDENSIEKLHFNQFQKSLTKNRAFGNSIFFLQQFFMFRGGKFPTPPFPLAMPLIGKLYAY